MAAGPPKQLPTFLQPNGFKVTALPIAKGIGNTGDWKTWAPVDMSGVALDFAKLQAMPVDAHECEGYTEHCDENGLETSRVFQVPWSQAAAFTQWAYGYSYTKQVSGTISSTTDPPVYKLYRVIPAQDWYRPYLYCDHVALEQGEGKCVPDPQAFVTNANGHQLDSNGNDVNQDANQEPPPKPPPPAILPAMVYADNLGVAPGAVLGIAAPGFTLADGMARFRVRYRGRPYPVRNDTDAEGHKLAERSRWVQVKRNYAIQALPLARVALADAANNKQLKFVNGPAGIAGSLIPEAGVILMPTQSYEVTWWDLPFDPDPAIRACMGRVNAEDGFVIAPGFAPCGAETLLMQAPETRGPYRNAAGAIVWHTKFRLDQRLVNQPVNAGAGLAADGWNFFPAGDGNFYRASFGGGNFDPTVFKSAPFVQLFAIQAPPVW